MAYVDVEEGGGGKLDLTKQPFHRSPFAKRRLIVQDLHVSAGDYILLPCTYDMGKSAPYKLRISSTVPISIVQWNDS